MLKLKTNKIISTIVVLIFSFTAHNASSKVIKIKNCEELQKVQFTEFESHYELSNNINCSSSREWNQGKGFVPIELNGVFDGKGYTINKLYISRPDEDELGLFSAGKGYIKDLTLKNVSIEGNKKVGALIGFAVESVIKNCHASGTVSGWADTGGLVGRFIGNFSEQNRAFLVDSSFNVDVNVKADNQINNLIDIPYRIGGLIGYTYWHTQIINSHASGNVNYTEDTSNLRGMMIGGLIGSAGTQIIPLTLSEDRHNVPIEEVIIHNCSTNSNVSGEDVVGGLVGILGAGALYGYFGIDNDSKIINSFSKGSVSALDRAGGLVGHVSESDLVGSYSKSSVLSKNSAGGLVSVIWSGDIIDSYTENPLVEGETVAAIAVAQSGGTISKTYSKSKLRGYKNSAFIYNLGDSSVQDCYSQANIEYINRSLINELSEEETKLCHISSPQGIYGLFASAGKSHINNYYYRGETILNGDLSLPKIDYNYCRYYKGYEHDEINDIKSIFAGLTPIYSKTKHPNVEIHSSFWDKEKSSILESAHGEALVSQDFVDKNNFTGWDFENVWELKQGSSAPTLRAIDDIDFSYTLTPEDKYGFDVSYSETKLIKDVRLFLSFVHTFWDSKISKKKIKKLKKDFQQQRINALNDTNRTEHCPNYIFYDVNNDNIIDKSDFKIVKNYIFENDLLKRKN